MKRIKYQEHQWVICVDLSLDQQYGFRILDFYASGIVGQIWTSDKNGMAWEEIYESYKAKCNQCTFGARVRTRLPPLHIKIGLMKQFVEALNADGSCIEYIGYKLLGQRETEGVNFWWSTDKTTYIWPKFRSITEWNRFICLVFICSCCDKLS